MNRQHIFDLFQIDCRLPFIEIKLVACTKKNKKNILLVWVKISEYFTV